MMFRTIALIVLVPLVVACAANRSTLEQRGFRFRELPSGGRVYRYAIHVPRAYDANHAWPLILFLHGMGESGTDGVKQVTEGIGPALQRHGDRWPAIVVLPQKPTAITEWEQHEPALMAILAAVRGDYRVDQDRIYLTGLSQGGHGTWVLGARHRDLWAALVSVCGYAGTPASRGAAPDLPPAYTGTAEELAAGIGDLPVWLFHGGADEVVPSEEAREMARALTPLGRPPRLTIYPGVHHDAWDRAYADPELPVWLFSQRRSRR